MVVAFGTKKLFVLFSSERRDRDGLEAGLDRGPGRCRRRGLHAELRTGTNPTKLIICPS